LVTEARSKCGTRLVSRYCSSGVGLVCHDRLGMRDPRSICA
jgi:hypothetical protein